MKKLLYLLAAVAFFACNETPKREEKKDSLREGVEKIGQDVKAAAGDAGDYLDEERHKLKGDLEERKNDIDKKMDQLKSDGSARSKEARKKLGHLRDQINGKLDELKNGTAAGWDSTRTDIDSALKRSDREWTDFKQDFKELFQ
jgi:uncharacterized protein YicC (UPF0701 family)